MSNHDRMGECRPHRGDLKRMRQIDQGLANSSARPQTGWRDRWQSIKLGYWQQWEEQPFNFGCMHFGVVTIIGGVLFAIFILPPAF